MKKSNSPKRRNHPESELQQSCVNLFQTLYQKDADLLFAIPNGGWRSKTEACIMKGEGIRPGVADLFLMIARGRFHGLWLELKVGLNNQSDHQKLFQQDAEKQGYSYVVIRTVEEFYNTIQSYLNLV